MGFFDFFRRPPPIRDAAALADFIDQNAAFLVQKGIYEYSRARAGHYAKVLFREPEFQQAVEQSRWRPIRSGSPWWRRLVEGMLRPHGADRRAAARCAQRARAVGVRPLSGAGSARRRTPGATARAELARRLQLIGLHPPKRAMDIPEPWAETYFDLMPIHEKLRGRDFPTMRNYLRVTMINIHDEFSKRMDAPALASALSAEAAR